MRKILYIAAAGFSMIAANPASAEWWLTLEAKNPIGFEITQHDGPYNTKDDCEADGESMARDMPNFTATVSCSQEQPARFQNHPGTPWAKPT